jgi:DNA-binding transcriptional MerR regulator
MLISDFARRAGLSTDTVRYYVRVGLLTPEISAKGGSNPYQVFRDDHLLAARIIRTAQSLGMSLKEIAAISQERRRGGMTRERSVEVLQIQLRRVEEKACEASVMKAYLDAKIAWLRDGERGPPPNFDLAPRVVA